MGSIARQYNKTEQPPETFSQITCRITMFPFEYSSPCVICLLHLLKKVSKLNFDHMQMCLQDAVVSWELLVQKGGGASMHREGRVARMTA